MGKTKKANVTTTTITETKDIDENMVYVYNSKQSVNVPCVSPLCLALETYLRMTKTEYKKASTEKKVEKVHGDPKMMLNRQEYSGLETCFENIGKTFAKNLDHLADTELTADQKADAEAFVKAEVETVLFCILSAIRSKKHQDGSSGAHELMKRLRNGAQQLLKPKEIDDRNMSKMTTEDLSKKAKDTLMAVSNYVQRGNENKFFFGDKPTKFDSILFGVLAQFYFDPPVDLNLKEHIDESAPKLADYLKHIKETYWTDWTECCAAPPALPAAKTASPEAKSTDTEKQPAAPVEVQTNGEPTVNGAPHTVVLEEKKSPIDESVPKIIDTGADVPKPVVVIAAEAPIAAADASTPSGEMVNGVE